MLSFSKYIKEVYQEERGGTFTNDDKEYNLNKVLRLTNNLPTMEFKVADLKWLVTDSKQEIKDFDKEEKQRVINADLNTPILVTYWKKKLVVLDGFHRLIDAVKEKRDTMIGKFVTDDILEKALVKKP